MVKFGPVFIPFRPSAEIAEDIKFVEDCGFDFAMVADENFCRDVYSTLTMSVLRTEKIKIGTGITNPYIRHPAYTAVAIATINEISNGRAFLGIGTGGSMTLNPVCIERKIPATTVREAVEVIRKLLDGEKVNYNGKTIKLKNAKLLFEPRNRIPIFIACRGPRMLEIGGKIADAVIMGAVPLNYVEYAINQIKKGAKSAGRDLSEVEIGYWTHISLSEDLEIAKKLANLEVAYTVADTMDFILEKAGIDMDLVNPIRDAFKEYNVEKAKALVEDTLVDQFVIYGSSRKCVEKFKLLKEMGINLFVIGPPLGPDKKEAIETIGKDIIPRFK